MKNNCRICKNLDKCLHKITTVDYICENYENYLFKSMNDIIIGHDIVFGNCDCIKNIQKDIEVAIECIILITDNQQIMLMDKRRTYEFGDGMTYGSQYGGQLSYTRVQCSKGKLLELLKRYE